MTKRLLTLTLFVPLMLAVACGATSAHRLTRGLEPATEARKQPEPDPQRSPLKLPLRDPKILVKKGQRQLLLFSEGR